MRREAVSLGNMPARITLQYHDCIFVMNHPVTVRLDLSEHIIRRRGANDLGAIPFPILDLDCIMNVVVLAAHQGDVSLQHKLGTIQVMVFPRKQIGLPDIPGVHDCVPAIARSWTVLIAAYFRASETMTFVPVNLVQRRTLCARRGRQNEKDEGDKARRDQDASLQWTPPPSSLFSMPNPPHP